MNIDLRNLPAYIANQIEAIKKENAFCNTNKAAALKAINEYRKKVKELDELKAEFNKIRDSYIEVSNELDEIKAVFKKIIN